MADKKSPKPEPKKEEKKHEHEAKEDKKKEAHHEKKDEKDPKALATVDDMKKFCTEKDLYFSRVYYTMRGFD